jgi:hypothetical protein
MGVNIDKNEYYEIILSNSARPDEFKKKIWDKSSIKYWVNT